MRYVYEIIYTPFENNDKGYPWLYSGSDYHARPSYYGSPSSKKVFSYTEGLSLCNWWKKELRSNPHHFKKVILVELSDNVNRKELLSLESAIQKKENGNNPKPGCWKGKNPNENKRWFTNGIVAIYINITKQIPPEGLYPGRKIKC